MKRRAMLQSLLAAGAVSFAQQSDFTMRRNVRLVLLDVSDRDKTGALVSGMAKNDFTVFEDGHKEGLTVFAHDDLPVNIGILVDESASMRHKRDEVLAAADVFIRESNPRDEVFVLSFNDRVVRDLPAGVDFSDDRRQLHAALLRALPQGQ